MKVSAILPAYQTAHLFRPCLCAVLAQTGVDLEILVCDDSPADGLRALVETEARGDSRVRYLAGARTGNPVDNWNQGLDAAAGEACVVVHHDEVLPGPDYLARAARLLAASGAPAVAAPVRVEARRRPSRFPQARALAAALGRPSWLLPALNWIGPTAAFVFRPGPRFDPGLVQLVDVDFYRRVLGAGPLARLDGPPVRSLGHHPDQIAATLDRFATARRDLRVLRDRRPPSLSGVEYAAFVALAGLQGLFR